MNPWKGVPPDWLRVDHETRRFVIGNIGVDRTNPADIVGKFRKIGPEFADIHAALAILLVFERGLHQFTRSPFGTNRTAGQRLAVVFFQLGLGIEAIQSGASSIHEQEDDALHFGRVVENRLTARSIERYDSLGLTDGLLSMPAKASIPKPLPTRRKASRRVIGFCELC